MAVGRPSVEGIELINIVRQARETVAQLKAANWDKAANRGSLAMATNCIVLDVVSAMWDWV